MPLAKAGQQAASPAKQGVGRTHAQTSFTTTSAIRLGDGADNLIVWIDSGEVRVIGSFGRHIEDASQELKGDGLVVQSYKQGRMVDRPRELSEAGD